MQRETRLREQLRRITDEDLEALAFDWQLFARPEQLPPESGWKVFLFRAGRGSGKTRAAAEWFHAQAMSGKYRRGAMVAPTPADARDFMVEGDSGLLHVGHPADRPIYEPSKRKLTWSSGFEALIYSAEDPDQIRGPNVAIAWASEVGAWPRLKALAAWDNLEFTLRIGPDPRVIVDTTPRAGSPVLKALKGDPGVIVSTSSTYANAINLAPDFLARMLQKYEGTRLGRQELGGEELEDVEGALWTWDMIQRVDKLPRSAAIFAVGVDPSGSSGGDEAGVVACATDRERQRLWVVEDVSAQCSPNEWARRSVDLWAKMSERMPGAYGEIVVETNFGGDMCVSTIESHIRDRPDLKERPRIVKVTASRGKRIRAEPVAGLYEQGRAFHVGSELAELETEMTGWDASDGSPSPNRVDSCVWGAIHLMFGKRKGPLTW